MRISIAICTWNRCELLRQTLEQMTRMRVPADLAWEVIVVNNNATDATDAVIAGFTSRLPLRRCFEPMPGVSNARNRAVQEAKGDYILWTDDDVLVDENWLVDFGRVTLRHPTAAVFGGPIDPWFPMEPDADLCEAFYWLRMGFCGLDNNLPEGRMSQTLPVWGANFAIRRSALGGLRFNPALGPSPTAPGGGGDETTLIAALRERGEAIVWCPGMRVRHYVAPERMSQCYLEALAEVRGRQAVLAYSGEAGPLWFSVPRWFWRNLVQVRVMHWLSQVAPGVTSLPGTLRSGPVPSGPSGRVTQLTWLREYRFLQGMFHGFRERYS
jgi:glycosyltransferase involved in cell wall biosynthesis